MTFAKRPSVAGTEAVRSSHLSSRISPVFPHLRRPVSLSPQDQHPLSTTDRLLWPEGGLMRRAVQTGVRIASAFEPTSSSRTLLSGCASFGPSCNPLGAERGGGGGRKLPLLPGPIRCRIPCSCVRRDRTVIAGRLVYPSTRSHGNDGAGCLLSHK